MVKTILGPLGLGKQLRRRLLEAHAICVNGDPVFMTSRVHADDVLTVDAVAETSPTVLPEEIPLTVAFEDEHVLVVNKPAGMVVHPTGRFREGTMVGAIAHHMQELGEDYRIRPIHRLDRETSGLILVAKHKLAHERLERAIRRREIEREYIAFVRGIMTAVEMEIDAPIGLPEGVAIRRVVMAEGKPAFTYVTRLGVFSSVPASKVALKLGTGRTHQIRVHMAYVGHPLLGDSLYGGGDQPFVCQRQALHAMRLAFIHPIDGQPREVHAPLPDDLLALEQQLASNFR